MPDFGTNLTEEPVVRVATAYYNEHEITESYTNTGLEQLLFGDVLGGRYEINHGTGSMKPGGQAILYYCHQSGNLNREYVVKLYDRSAFPKEKNADGFFETLQKLSSIKSDCIVNIVNYGSFQYGNTQYIYAVTPKYSPFPEDRYSMECAYRDENYERRFISLVSCFARALRILEQNDIIHCDIKKSNIMWNDEAGCPVLIDFAGAIRHGADDKTTPVFATTAWNFPPEARETHSANKFTDFYMLGRAILEIIKGEIKLAENAAIHISDVQVPAMLPPSLYFLLEGLMFNSGADSLYKKYRFNCDKLDEWVKNARNGAYKAADINAYITNRKFVFLGAADPADARPETKSLLGITYPLTIERNERPVTFYSDADLAIALSEDTKWGYNLIMNDVEFYFPNSPMMKKKSAELKQLEKEKGRKNTRMDTVYVKFVLGSLPESRKNIFFWPALPYVKSIGAFGDELRKILMNMRGTGYDWTLERTENETSAVRNARKIRGVFNTDILSFYFKLNGNDELSRLASDIEAAFSNHNEKSELNTMALWKLAYAVCENKIFRIGEKWYTDIDKYYAHARELTEKEDYEALFSEQEIIMPDGNYETGFLAWAQATRK